MPPDVDEETVESLVERASGSPLALINIARTVLMGRGDVVRALALADRALAAAPDDGEVRTLHAEIVSANVGVWYFNMVRDAPRHAVYERVMRCALANGESVLDLGAGAGLFAMMAARAGAGQVIACERKPAVADAARAVIARNGLEDRVRVVGKPSTELVLGVDLEAPVDVLIWDNLANDLVGAAALPAIEDAVRRLLKPGGAVIPARGAIMAALAFDEGLETRLMGVAEGFDLTPFNALAKPVYTMKCDTEGLSLASSAAELFGFDFTSGGPFLAAKAVKPVSASAQRANAIVQWLSLDLDHEESWSTRPGGPALALGLEVHPLAREIVLVDGETRRIGAAHDRQALRIWLEE
jgi:protein-L-isoaspartate O-methyltransferase